MPSAAHRSAPETRSAASPATTGARATPHPNPVRHLRLEATGRCNLARTRHVNRIRLDYAGPRTTEPDAWPRGTGILAAEPNADDAGVGTIESTLSSRVREFVTTMNDIGDRSGATSGKMEQQISSFHSVSTNVLRDITVLAQKFDEHGKALNAASHFEIDDVIDPADTRRWITTAFAAAPAPPPRSGKKRPNIDTW